ncbi:hypothetical protein H6F73_19005 [Microcoleus sp. FACHB-68]|nr:hypothetical protein [Microcoleus sp. FACHB-68]
MAHNQSEEPPSRFNSPITAETCYLIAAAGEAPHNVKLKCFTRGNDNYDSSTNQLDICGVASTACE